MQGCTKDNQYSRNGVRVKPFRNEFAHHRLTQILTEFNQFKIREIKFCGNLC